jgi:hypothetical protein
VVFCLLAAFACGGSGGPNDPLDEHGIIRIHNRSATAVVEVNISRCDVAEWGANRLAGSIGQGQSRDFELTPNCYDVRAVGTTAEEVHFFDLALTRGSVLVLEILDG